MKILSILSIIILLTASCQNRKFTMQVCTGHDFTYKETWVECDSFQMIDKNQALIWVDGTKMKIIGERGISPLSN